MTVYDLWIPVVVTGLVTHILSTLAWMVLPHHKPEWQKLPVEDNLQEMIASKQIPPGQYIFPFTDSSKEAATEEFKSKQTKSTGMLVIWSNPTKMGKAIGLTLTTFFVVAFVIGYLASLALPRGAEFLKVFQFVTTAGILAHVSAKFPHVFWFRRKIGMDVIDGMVYAVATGIIFGLLWPKV